MRKRYNSEEKARFLDLCRRYNKSAQNPGTDFVMLSLEIHSSRASVPQSWRSMSFIESVGI